FYLATPFLFLVVFTPTKRLAFGGILTSSGGDGSKIYAPSSRMVLSGQSWKQCQCVIAQNSLPQGRLSNGVLSMFPASFSTAASGVKGQSLP
ncbi:hypothetical protein, partial [Pseudomonas jessenii]|uniref:hypothetical protein n=1 Tax=Pseudomonas jessenii TaxID=77298 RepID=UPI0019D46766